MRVSDVMMKDVVSVPPETSLDEARILRFRHGIHGMPVVDHSGQLVGVVSMVDLVGKIGNGCPDHVSVQSSALRPGKEEQEMEHGT